MNAIFPILEDTRHRVTVDEVMELVRAGFFEDAGRIELIEGVIVEMAAEGSRHGEMKMRLGDAIYDRLDKSSHRRFIDTTLKLAPDQAPSPDIFVCREGVPLAELQADEVSLIIEVADTSLQKDRDGKGAIYARFGIPEYWIVDVEHDTVLVFRSPENGTYAESETFDFSDTLTCHTLPNLSLRISDFNV